MDIEGMVLAFYRCMMVALLLQLQLQQQFKITRFRVEKVTNEKNFVFSLTFFFHQIPGIIFIYSLDIYKLEYTIIFWLFEIFIFLDLIWKNGAIRNTSDFWINHRVYNCCDEINCFGDISITNCLPNDVNFIIYVLISPFYFIDTDFSNKPFSKESVWSWNAITRFYVPCS